VSSDVRTAPVDEEEEVKAADDIADDDLSDASVEGEHGPLVHSQYAYPGPAEEEQVVGMTVSKTLQAQMVDLLERAGRTGMILSVSVSLQPPLACSSILIGDRGAAERVRQAYYRAPAHPTRTCHAPGAYRESRDRQRARKPWA
jgi:hypothetical protein